MVLYELITLQIPYHETNLFDVKQQILSKILPPLKIVNNIYQPIVKLYQDCVQFDPSSRPSICDLLFEIKKI